MFSNKAMLSRTDNSSCFNTPSACCGVVYFGELHPFKQYQGSKARFETGEGTFELECFVHNVSEYFAAAKKNNLKCAEIKEWFDDENETNIPRLLTMIFEKTK